jgi:hypothetical protein
MKKLLCFGMVMVMSAAAFGTVSTSSIDGNISDWDAAYIIDDPDDDRKASNTMEMTRWGAYSDGSYLYWFAEIGNGKTWADFQVSGAEMYPGLWVDFDASTDTYLCDDDEPNCVDHNKREWGTELGGDGNHRGVDLNIEWGTDMGGTVNYWGGINTEPDPDVPGDVCIAQTGGANDITAISGSIIEVAVKLDGTGTDEVADALAATGVNPTTMGDYWLVGVAIQGKDSSTTWGYDVGTPIAIAKDPSTKALLPGDFDLDGDVDVSDLGILATNYGNTEAQSWAMGDSDHDADVDVSDLGNLATYYGTSAGGNPVNVPEPATMGLLALGAVGLLKRRRR